MTTPTMMPAVAQVVAAVSTPDRAVRQRLAPSRFGVESRSRGVRKLSAEASSTVAQNTESVGE